MELALAKNIYAKFIIKINWNIFMHPLLKKEHQQLLNLLDVLEKCISNGASVNQVYEYLSDFVRFAEEHFKNEETIMRAYGYPEIFNHKKEHAALLKELLIIKSKLAQGHTPFGKDYMQSLRSWLEVHLFGTDNRLEDFLYQVDAGSNKMADKAQVNI